MASASEREDHPARRVIPSTCWECSTTCGALITVDGDRAVEVKPNRSHPASRGAFCAKGVRALPEWTYRPTRLLHPLRRRGERGSGDWQQISMSEALDRVADGLAEAYQTHGPLALAAAVSGAFFSRGAVVALLMRALGSPNWLINQDLCGGCRGVSDRVTGLGITGAEDLDNARCALVVGRNAYAADPVQWRALVALEQRGGQMIVLDPNATPATRRAAVWLRPRPGTDAAIALAMIHVLVSENRHDVRFVDAHCHGFDALTERAARYTPAVASELTGVPAEDIVRAARIYADGPSVFVSGHGIDAFSAGFQTFRAFHCLVAISGNFDVAGGNQRVRKPRGMRTYLDLIHDPEFQLPDAIAQRALGAERYPLWTGPRGWQGACHNPSVIDAILTGDPYPLRAMLVSGVNIAITYPDTRRTVEALRSLDFLAVAAHELNPTAAWADVVLPKTTTLEEEEVQVQPRGSCVSYTQPAHPPLGEALTDIEIAAGLLDRLQKRIPIARELLPWRTQRELNTFLIGDSEIELEILARDGYQRFEPTDAGERTTAFNTPSGKIELYSSELAALGHDPLPDFVTPSAERVDEETRAAFPLLLLTGAREKNYHHSRFRDQEWLRRSSPHPRLAVHPLTADQLGLADADWVRIETAVAADNCTAELELSDRVPEGVVSTGMGWWYPEQAAPWFGALEANVNCALSYGGPYDPIVGSADSRGLRCRISRIDAPSSAQAKRSTI